MPPLQRSKKLQMEKCRVAEQTTAAPTKELSFMNSPLDYLKYFYLIFNLEGKQRRRYGVLVILLVGAEIDRLLIRRGW